MAQRLQRPSLARHPDATPRQESPATAAELELFRDEAPAAQVAKQVLFSVLLGVGSVAATAADNCAGLDGCGVLGPCGGGEASARDREGDLVARVR